MPRSSRPPRLRLLPISAALAACSPAPRPTAAAAETASGATFAGAAAPIAAAAMSYDALVAAPEPPMSLTASDGSGLELVRLEARAVIEGPLAFTELHLRFANPEDRVREGRFSITLPTGAAISRFAMAIDGRWMEAEMVERQAARRAYEDFLHRKQDPALLEKAAGNEFGARVFPIPAGGVKDLIVSYSQELTSSHAPYVLPLRGLPAIREVEATARVARPGTAAGGAAWNEVTLSQRQWKPDRDFAVAVDGQPGSVRHGELVAMRIAPELGAAVDAPRALTLLVDTSASRALGFDRQVTGVGEMVAALRAAHGDLRLTVAAFDQDVLPIFDGPASAFGKVHLDALRARQPLGASDLAAALGWAKTRAVTGRLVVLTDGVVTAGASERRDLEAAVHALAPAVERLDVVLSGGIRDDATASALARGQLGRDGAVLDLDRGAAEVARRLGLATRSGLTVAVDGARWVWPQRLDGVQPGDEAVVYASLSPAAAGRASVSVTIGDQVRRLEPLGVLRPLVERAAAGAEIARLQADLGSVTDTKRQRELAAAIVGLSTRHRVLSDQTALLVLETEQDYARFGIARTALADILVVDARGLALEHRAGPVMPIATGEITARVEKPKDADKKEEAKVAAFAAADGAFEQDAGAEGGVAGSAAGEDLAAVVEAEESASGYGQVGRGPGGGGSAGAVRREAPRASVGARGRADATRAGLVAPLAAPRPEPAPAPSDDRMMALDSAAARDEEPAPKTPALEGPLAGVMASIAARRTDEALLAALRWRKEQPGDVLALIALGEALEATGQRALAARAYGSIIDLFPGRADLRRFAGERLERLGDLGRPLAIDAYRRAVADRPDHLSGHRLLGYALVRAGRLADAFAALEAGAGRSYPDGRFRGGERILREDLGLVGAAWAAREPGRRAEIERRLAISHARLATSPSTRFVLYWETDANDVDFHIRDARGGHAYYQSMHLPSGGDLYADVTTGYGPECFTIPGKASAGPYQLQIHYYSKGPMGYGMGVLEILRHDGKGGLAFEHRPYVVMTDGAFVDLGTVDARTATTAIAR